MISGKNGYKCFIVDDNKLDRLTTVSFVRKYPFLEIAGVFDSAPAALEGADKMFPDVVFLDIDMPEFSGLDLRKQLAKVPACIFITAYPEYALQSFEVNALDFLTKPIQSDRFGSSMTRLQYFLEIHYKAGLLDHTLNEDSVFIKDGHEHIKIQCYDIVYLEALKDYTGIVTRDKKYCILTPLGNLLKEQSFKNFIRIHRSYAIQKHFIRKIDPRSVLVNDVSLPIGRTYKDTLNDLLTQ
jgi:two-component system LytT family response regulator